jgi:16S rRNA (guanine966-N2)-methyltransferase
VISGSARGTRLAPVPVGVRPLSDRAREGVFSHLGGEVRDARVLDLFAGTGAIGIEALSRGAASATFVDDSPSAAAAIRVNLDKTRLEPRGTVVRERAGTFLSRSPAGEGFHLVFLDPPYDDVNIDLEATLSCLTSGWLAKGWAVVLTRGVRSSTPVIPVDWHVARRLAYGDSLVLVHREVRWA